MDKHLSPQKAVLVAKIRAKQIRDAYDARHPKTTSPSTSTESQNSGGAPEQTGTNEEQKPGGIS